MTVDRTPPLLACELPLGREGIVVNNELVLSGWAASPVGVSGVAVQIGERVWNASYGLDTPLLAREVGDLPNVTRAGYRLGIDTSAWTPGPHYVTVAAFDLEGGRSAIEGSVDVQPFARDRAATVEGEAGLELDPPLDGSGETGVPLRVTGWAIAPAGIESVAVTIDGEIRHEALHPIARPDLLSSHGAEIAGAAGFALELSLDECPPGHHSVTVVASGRDGATFGVEREVTVLPDSSPVPLDHPLAPAAGGEPAGTDIVAMWKDRALLAEADAAASRAEARLALNRQEEALRAQRRAEAEDGADRPAPRNVQVEAVAAQGAGAMPRARPALEHRARYDWASRLASGETVLDVGCGSGAGTARLAEHAHRAVGVDNSPPAVLTARETHGDVAIFDEGDMRSLAFEDGAFDTVVCFEALTHVAETDLVLDELQRVLRPGGRLLISAPNHSAYPDGNPLHLNELTAEELERSLAARFETVAIYGQQTYFASLLGTAATLEHSDPRVQIEADVAKLVGTASGAAAFSVAVATDGPPPPEPVRLVLGEQPDQEELARELVTWKRRAFEAEAEAVALRRRPQD